MFGFFKRRSAPALPYSLSDLYSDGRRTHPIGEVIAALDAHVRLPSGLAEQVDDELVAFVRVKVDSGMDLCDALEAFALCVGRGRSVLSRFLFEDEVPRAELEAALNDPAEYRLEILALLAWDAIRPTAAERYVIGGEGDDEQRRAGIQARSERLARAERYNIERVALRR